MDSSREDGILKIRAQREEEGSREHFCVICQRFGHVFFCFVRTCVSVFMHI